MKVRKAVVPAAGLGTRTVQATKHMSKKCYLQQKTSKELCRAIYRAKTFVGNESFAVLIGDYVVY